MTFDSVVGIVRTLEAPTPQTSGGTTYDFVSWSDGGAALAQHLDAGGEHDLHGDLSLRPGGTGNGLPATYYDNADFTGTPSRDRSDRGLRLGHRVAGARHRRRHVQRALDRSGEAPVHRDLHVLHAERRRRPAVGQQRWS